MKNNVGILFIHGAGLGSYIWDNLLPKIHWPSLCIDFPNRKPGNQSNARLNFSDYLRAVIAQIDTFDKEHLVIVTHSIGGMIGLKVAEHYQERLIGFVGISAAIPESGHSFTSCLPFPQRLVVPLLMKLAGTKPPDAAIRSGLCNDLDEPQAQKVVENFTAESLRLYTEKISFSIPTADKLYVALSDDRGFPLTVQNKMADNLQSDEAVQLKSGHLPMMSIPDELAAVLNDFVDSCTEAH